MRGFLSVGAAILTTWSRDSYASGRLHKSLSLNRRSDSSATSHRWGRGWRSEWSSAKCVVSCRVATNTSTLQAHQAHSSFSSSCFTLCFGRIWSGFICFLLVCRCALCRIEQTQAYCFSNIHRLKKRLKVFLFLFNSFFFCRDVVRGKFTEVFVMVSAS